MYIRRERERERGREREGETYGDGAGDRLRESERERERERGARSADAAWPQEQQDTAARKACDEDGPPEGEVQAFPC